MICRITPSPDWFIGVDSFDLCRANKWVDSVTLDLQPTDGGTDNGYTFTSPKWATDPRSNITPIRSRYPDHPASSFFYPELEKLPRIAWVSFLKLKEFFLSKQFTKNIKTESRIEDESISTSTRSTIKSSSINELKKYSLKQNPKLKKDIRKGLYPELGAFRSKGETTTKGKVRRTPKHLKNRPRSCRVSEWSDWSTCSKSCEIGEKTRKRKVIHFASRSGRPCPPLEETTWCRVSENCPNETAFFSWR
ncbi:spondin-1-like [Stegodyphus dumicola]|uniref:spondin-1-like n=1 Tax=Stegodyphus dumicola TaxID=202533 RepID=UPI0015B25209|nr:spondin-1-like [Stegodyphus dumicola]